MADDELRPLPFDPSREEVQSFVDMAVETGEWWLLNAGEYSSAAVETMKEDGSNFQRAVLVSFPVKRNKTHEEKQLYLLMHPDDAEGFAERLAETARWMKIARRMEG